MKKTKEELIEEFKTIAGENVTSDESIAFLENLSDSMEVEEAPADEVDWKEKYDELDMEWRKKYIERFSEGAEGETEETEETEETKETEEERAESIGYDDLFEEKKEKKEEEEE